MVEQYLTKYIAAILQFRPITIDVEGFYSLTFGDEKLRKQCLMKYITNLMSIHNHLEVIL